MVHALQHLPYPVWNSFAQNPRSNLMVEYVVSSRGAFQILTNGKRHKHVRGTTFNNPCFLRLVTESGVRVRRRYDTTDILLLLVSTPPSVPKKEWIFLLHYSILTFVSLLESSEKDASSHIVVLLSNYQITLYFWLNPDLCQCTRIECREKLWRELELTQSWTP